MTEEALRKPIYVQIKTNLTETDADEGVCQWESNNYPNSWLIAKRIMEMERVADSYHGTQRVFTWNTFDRNTGVFEVNSFEIDFDDQKGGRVLLRNMSQILKVIHAQKDVEERLPRVIGDFAKLK